MFKFIQCHQNFQKWQKVFIRLAVVNAIFMIIQNKIVFKNKRVGHAKHVHQKGISNSKMTNKYKLNFSYIYRNGK